jgi:hypothetical protein
MGGGKEGSHTVKDRQPQPVTSAYFVHTDHSLPCTGLPIHHLPRRIAQKHGGSRDHDLL